MSDAATREAENAVDRLLSHMGNVRHYMPVHAKPWVIKEMAMILAEIRNQTPPLLSQEEAFQRAAKAGLFAGLVSKPEDA